VAKFNFKLEGVLRLREKLEDLKKNEFGAAMQALERERIKLALLEQDRENTIESFRQSINEGIEPEDIHCHNNYLAKLKFLIRQQHIAIKRAEAFVELKRLELVEAMKDRKSLDILKENKFEEFMVEEKQAEQKIVDEIVSYKGAVGKR
jgi:flagellar FliJ protein